MSPLNKEESAPSVMWRVTIAFAAAMALALVLADPGKSASENPAQHSAAAPVDYLPGVKLLDQNGRALSLASLRGRPVLISFIHASCQGACEMITAKMKMVAHSLGSKFDTSVTMVSITTDPRHDGPTQLLTYAKNEGADAKGWLFLTGKPQEVGRILTLYHAPVEEPDDAMTHDFDLFLIGPDGHEVRQYPGMKIPPEVVASDIRRMSAHR